jgi:hypothetical protein
MYDVGIGNKSKSFQYSIFGTNDSVIWFKDLTEKEKTLLVMKNQQLKKIGKLK